MQLVRTAAALLLVASTSFANDYYVDAQLGSNSNGGSSASDAWKTITFALSQVPTPAVGQANSIHIASGTYDATLGESFPLAMRPGLQLIGDPLAHPLLDGGSQDVDLMNILAQTPGAGASFDALTLIQRIDMRRAKRGIYINGEHFDARPRILDLEISSMSVAGIEIDAFIATVYPQLDDLTLDQNAVGLACFLNDLAKNSGFDLSSSSVSNNASYGIHFLAWAGTFNTQGRFAVNACQLIGNGGPAIYATGANQAGFTALVSNSLIAHSATDGLVFLTDDTVQPEADVESCTIADNHGIGCAFEVPGGHALGAQLHETILWANVDDLQLAGLVNPSVSYCDIGDGDFAGTNGNFSADPRFADAVNGDYSLLSGSPCIDSGDPLAPLDADCSRSDVGAFAALHSNPAIYCTAKLNSCGSLPTMSASGAPSASASSGFVVGASNTKAGKAGLLLYSVNGRAAIPFNGGVLCLAGSVKRSIPLFDTTGSGSNCNGRLEIDVNAFAQGALGGHPLGALTIPGTRVDCQIWGRDVLGQSLLSDALEYFVCP